jgi:hypothetical protein
MIPMHMSAFVEIIWKNRTTEFARNPEVASVRPVPRVSHSGAPRAPKWIHLYGSYGSLVLPPGPWKKLPYRSSKGCLPKPKSSTSSLVGGAAVDTFYLFGIRWGVGFVDLKEFVFLLLLLIVFEGISCQVRFLGMWCFDMVGIRNMDGFSEP